VRPTFPGGRDPATDRATAFPAGASAVHRVFGRPEHPLLLFLDDLQWLEAATLDLLADLLTQP
jgi:hypothetical protein